ncbi:MAG: adenylate cyclase, partial [Candidatus Poribacteria bacterium]|nr:adenylate cyclase [Candidatus Poribacteria bacterium]
ISRNSSFYYKDKQINIQEVAEKLGVQYLLEGSVQVSGDNIRVSTQLVDAINGKNLWADRLDEKLDDLFRVQDMITQKILEELEIKCTPSAPVGQKRMIV